ncbi:MAG: FAD-binding oxidoreductase [Haliscomenobacter sp.]|nr:FAD-binding oxidoreductase [Haliscomenobacter sp.]
MKTFTAAPWSYWETSSFLEGYPVAVLGSGIVGLSAAIQLRTAHPGLPVLVLERGPLPAGASTKNAGFACFGSMTELLDDLTHQSEDFVWALVERRYRGLRRLREKLGDLNMRYEPLGGYELFREEEDPVYQACLHAMPEFNRRLKSITGLEETFQMADGHISGMGFHQVRHLVKNTGEGQIHTGAMMKALLRLAREKGVEIMNGFQVTGIRPESNGVWLECNGAGDLFFEKVLVATNGLTRLLLPDLRVSPARNQVLITKPIPGLPFQGSFHYDRGYYYFRNIDGRILLGGGRNLDPEGEKTSDFGTTPMIQDALLRLLNEVILPGREPEVDRWWSGILGIGEEKSPIVRKLTPNLCVAVRMGGMGVAIGTLVGEEAAGLLVEH